MKVKNRIDYYIKKRGFRQVDIARKLKIGTVSVNRWCKNLSNPEDETAEQLKEILLVATNELFYVEE